MLEKNSHSFHQQLKISKDRQIDSVQREYIFGATAEIEKQGSIAPHVFLL